jgi:hypothetical protein
VLGVACGLALTLVWRGAASAGIPSRLRQYAAGVRSDAAAAVADGRRAAAERRAELARELEALRGPSTSR